MKNQLILFDYLWSFDLECVPAWACTCVCVETVRHILVTPNSCYSYSVATTFSLYETLFFWKWNGKTWVLCACEAPGLDCWWCWGYRNIFARFWITLNEDRSMMMCYWIFKAHIPARLRVAMEKELADAKAMSKWRTLLSTCQQSESGFDDHSTRLCC